MQPIHIYELLLNCSASSIVAKLEFQDEGCGDIVGYVQ